MTSASMPDPPRPPRQSPWSYASQAAARHRRRRRRQPGTFEEELALRARRIGRQRARSATAVLALMVAAGGAVGMLCARHGQVSDARAAPERQGSGVVADPSSPPASATPIIVMATTPPAGTGDASAGGRGGTTSTRSWPATDPPPAGQGDTAAQAGPQTSTTSAPAESDTATAYYQNCQKARAAGAAPIYRDEPGYRDKLDKDGDGIACDE